MDSCLHRILTGFAYVISLIVYQIGGLFTGEASFGPWTVVAAALVAVLLYLLFRKGYQPKDSAHDLTSVAANS